eukprot:CAMPEP_0180443618 /NCGR_PEP_ID=MMETSP1036_2-20121128/14771_1 /TAXON_ID=632150 /ORGANISM="Azadinium spinosum, Strain 3D9" /LENGTH=116 /DNA_ID=CAMNT_0022449943 /DNA_START=228 /DNA_END=578 /DNA_ORIENTATION=-
MMSNGSCGQCVAGVGDGLIWGVSAQVSAELVYLEVLIVDNGPKDALQIFNACNLIRSLQQQQFGHIHCVEVVRDHLLHKGHNRIGMEVMAKDTHLPVHLAIDRLQALLELCIKSAL